MHKRMATEIGNNQVTEIKMLELSQFEMKMVSNEDKPDEFPSLFGTTVATRFGSNEPERSLKPIPKDVKKMIDELCVSKSLSYGR